MVCRFNDPHGVVDHDVTYTGSWLADVEKNHANLAMRKLVHQMGVHFGGHDDDAVHLTFQHAPDTVCHAS
jgi:hypothetical protein